MEDVKPTKPNIHIEVSPTVVCRLLRTPHTVSGDSQGQTIVFMVILMLFAFSSDMMSSNILCDKRKNTFK